MPWSWPRRPGHRPRSTAFGLSAAVRQDVQQPSLQVGDHRNDPGAGGIGRPRPKKLCGGERPVVRTERRTDRVCGEFLLVRGCDRGGRLRGIGGVWDESARGRMELRCGPNQAAGGHLERIQHVVSLGCPQGIRQAVRQVGVNIGRLRSLGFDLGCRGREMRGLAGSVGRFRWGRGVAQSGLSAVRAAVPGRAGLRWKGWQAGGGRASLGRHARPDALVRSVGDRRHLL